MRELKEYFASAMIFSFLLMGFRPTSLFFPFSFPEFIILSPSCQLISTSPCNSEIPDSSFESQHRSTAALPLFRISLTFPALRPKIG